MEEKSWNVYYKLENFLSVSPNVVVQWLTLLLRIRDLQGSYIGPKTGYPDSGLSWFSTVPLGECWDSNLKLVHDRFLQNLFQFIIYLSFSTMQSELLKKRR
jgi:hypothetical protein